MAGRYIERGESKEITLYLNGKSYKAKLNNNRIDKKFGPHADIVQIRYTQNSDLAQALRGCFVRSYAYISKMKALQEKGSKKHISIPDDCKKYLVVYTTEYDDTYILETIEAEDIQSLRATLSGYSERVMEAHHIDYFVKSLNNDAKNQIIVCPNHHSVIHDVDPVFDRSKLIYVYANGFEEKIVLNQHL